MPLPQSRPVLSLSRPSGCFIFRTSSGNGNLLDCWFCDLTLECHHCFVGKSVLHQGYVQSSESVGQFEASIYWRVNFVTRISCWLWNTQAFSVETRRDRTICTTTAGSGRRQGHIYTQGQQHSISIHKPIAYILDHLLKQASKMSINRNRSLIWLLD